MRNASHVTGDTPIATTNSNTTLPLRQAAPLAVQHVLAMFVSNVTPAIIIAGVAGIGVGDTQHVLYMMQMAMVFAGIATILQTVGVGPVGARLPIMQGTSFAFIPIMAPLVAGQGVAAMAVLTGGIIVAGLCHALLGTAIKHIRFALPPLVTGLIVLMIGLALLQVGIQYAAGGTQAIGTPAYGDGRSWLIALVVIAVTVAVKCFARGFAAIAAVLVGIIAGYLVALVFGMVDFTPVHRANWWVLPQPLYFGVTFQLNAIIAIALMSVVSAIETVGDVAGITQAGANREPTDREIAGATYADGLGSAIAGLFGALPNTSFSQNVGLVAMTGVMSRHVVTLAALILIVAGCIPKVGAIIATCPIEVLGGGVIVMFGMICAAGMRLLATVQWHQRNMIIFGVSLSIGFGLQLQPAALGHLPPLLQTLLASGLLPAAALAITLNLLLPQRLRGE